MDVKTEAMTGNQNNMCGMNLQMMFDMLMRSEQCEAALYAQLAQIAPTPCLQQMIAHMVMMEQNQPVSLAAVAAAYGLGAAAPMMHGEQPAMAPQFYAVEEKKE